MFKSLVALALIGLASSAPQPRKVFHEHFEDFLAAAMSEVGPEFNDLFEQYLEFEEFGAALDYIKTNSFRDLVHEMESLPEFKAVVDFLEKDNIDIHFFLDLIDDMIDNKKRSTRATASGKDFSSYLEDSISLLPKEKLAALYEEKMAEDEVFRNAIENLSSAEWDEVFSALWESNVFQAEVQTLLTYGIDIHVILKEIRALFGQN